MKKNCNIIKDLLPLYKDNVVSKETKEYVEEHLKTCKDCQNYLRDLQYKVENTNKQDIHVFKTFAKKIHIKQIRNTFLGILYFAILSYCILYFMGTYPFKIKYNKEIEGGFYSDGISSNYFYQLSAPMNGIADGIKVEKDGITYLFITWKSTLINQWEKFDGTMVGTPKNNDFRNIDLTKKVRVYYTTANLKKISTASDKEWDKLLKKSTLLFNEETKQTKIDCTLNNENYSYTLHYYKLNDQVIEGFGGENFPLEIQIRKSSIKDGKSTSMWYEGGKASEIFTRTEQYMKERGGSCNRIDLGE